MRLTAGYACTWECWSRRGSLCGAGQRLVSARHDPRVFDFGSDEFQQSGPDEVSAALDRLLIRDALTQLSHEQRAVIRRSYQPGWTMAQIAEDLQIPEGTVKSRMHYALRALRLILQEMGVTRA